MTGEERRAYIQKCITEADAPVSGLTLAGKLGVSRQVIVQDIALLRANGFHVTATNRGYITDSSEEKTKVFKVIHSDQQVEEELNIFVDCGAEVVDVFVYHKVYGVVKAKMNIKSRRDVKKYMEQLSAGKSSLLKNITAGYHYHTIKAESKEILDSIQEELKEKGMLARLQDYEPVDFGK